MLCLKFFLLFNLFIYYKIVIPKVYLMLGVHCQSAKLSVLQLQLGQNYQHQKLDNECPVKRQTVRQPASQCSDIVAHVKDKRDKRSHKKVVCWNSCLVKVCID